MRDWMGELGAAGFKSLSLKVQRTPMSKRRRENPSSRRERERIHSFFSFFVLFGPSMAWMMPTYFGEGTNFFLLSLLIQMSISSEKHPYRHTPK